MKPTIKDVAKIASVSISTVSRVMNAPDTVVENKKKRVLDAIEELKYKPNALARGLIYKKTHTLGVVIPDIRNPYYADIIRGMEDASKKSGYSLIICNTDTDGNRLFSYLNTFYEKQIDGLLYTSNPIFPDYYKELKRLRMPVVLVATHSMEYELPSVKINDEQAAYDATQFLIDSGHRNIGMISFDLGDSIAGQTRYQGFVRALRENNLELKRDNIFFVSEYFHDPYDAAESLFRQSSGLTAVFAVSDVLAMGVLSYLNEKGVAVPNEVSVVGFDNIRLSAFTVPKLTTVAQPMYQIGYRAVEKLHALINGEADPVLREIVPHEIVVRASTGRL
ncbi:LacI family DNA-binding transcriptional regulator [Cohnella yongneupensis]|uniref:LacI family DNA-binding transcriptional regulator n=1 Tax=Cohnella yongneupensis TaxID=425006 RepID=A0ABW0R4U7_9BACL